MGVSAQRKWAWMPLYAGSPRDIFLTRCCALDEQNHGPFKEGLSMFKKRAMLLGGFVGMLVVGAVVTAGLALAQHRAQGLYDALPTRTSGIVIDTDDNDMAIVWSSNGTVHKVLGAGCALGELVECTTQYRFTVCEKV
jgi:hypothetical protein